MTIVSFSACSITLTPRPASVVEALLHGILILGLVYIYPLIFPFGILVFYSFLRGFVVGNLCNVKPQAMILPPFTAHRLSTFMITYPCIILSTYLIASLTYPHTHSSRTNGCHVQYQIWSTMLFSPCRGTALSQLHPRKVTLLCALMFLPLTSTLIKGNLEDRFLHDLNVGRGTCVQPPGRSDRGGKVAHGVHIEHE